MTDDRILELVVDLAPSEEYTDPEDGLPCFNTLGFARKFAAAVRLEALEEAAKVCDQMVSVSAISYETGSACADAIRALSQKDPQ